MKRVIDYLIKYCDRLILFIDIVIIIALTILTCMTVYFLAKDVLTSYKIGSSSEITVIMNHVFLLVIYIELIRIITAGYKRSEMYVLSIAEVGFVITVREVLASVISKTTMDLVLSSIASLSFAIILWIMYEKILPKKK